MLVIACAQAVWQTPSNSVIPAAKGKITTTVRLISMRLLQMLLGLPNDQSLGVRLLGGIIHLNEGAKNYLGQRSGCAADTDA